MAKIQAYLMQWLSKNEHLGYDEYNVPHIDHMKDVAAYQIKYWEYHGYRKERTYYTKRKPLKITDKSKTYIIDKNPLQRASLNENELLSAKFSLCFTEKSFQPKNQNFTRTT